MDKLIAAERRVGEAFHDLTYMLPQADRERQAQAILESVALYLSASLKHSHSIDWKAYEWTHLETNGGIN